MEVASTAARTASVSFTSVFDDTRKSRTTLGFAVPGLHDISDLDGSPAGDGCEGNFCEIVRGPFVIPFEARVECAKFIECIAKTRWTGVHLPVRIRFRLRNEQNRRGTGEGTAYTRIDKQQNWRN